MKSTVVITTRNRRDDLVVALRSCVAQTALCEIVVIDEIGPMELFSQKFKTAVKDVTVSMKPVLAVVHAKAQNQLVNELKQRDDAEIFLVTLTNRNALVDELTKKLEENLKTG